MTERLIVPIADVLPGDVMQGDGPAKRRVVERVERIDDYVHVHLVDGTDMGPTRADSVYFAVVERSTS